MTEVVREKAAKSRSGALTAGLREAQKERSKKPTVSLDDLSDDDDETNPLCAACQSGKANAVRRALQGAGGDPCAVGSQGTTPLFIASQAGRSEIVSLLLEAHADPAQACFGGATPLYMACSRNHADIVRLLIRAGAPVDALANGYFTPLLAAVSHGCEEAARAVLAEGADVHQRSMKWGSYLHAAAKNGKLEMLKLLVAFEADLEAEFEGQTPLALAEERGHSEAASLLRKAVERKAKARQAAEASARALSHAGGDASTPEALEAAYAQAVEQQKLVASEVAAAEQMLAEHTFIEISVEAARKVAHTVAVEEVAAGLHKDEMQNQLRMLAGGIGRREAAALAVEEVAAAQSKDEKMSRLRALVGAAVRRDATAQALADWRGVADDDAAQAHADPKQQANGSCGIDIT